MAKKILVGLSLAVIVMLAVPLGLMAASVVRGESPKQLAEKEQLGELDPGSEDDPQAEDVLKPVVQPDPGPMPPPPVLAEAEPAEEAAEPEPAPASGRPCWGPTKRPAWWTGWTAMRMTTDHWQHRKKLRTPQSGRPQLFCVNRIYRSGGEPSGRRNRVSSGRSASGAEAVKR